MHGREESPSTLPSDHAPVVSASSAAEGLDGFEAELVDALQPIRGYALAVALQHLFETGLFDALEGVPYADLPEVAARTGLNTDRLTAFLLYLQVEQYVAVHGSRVRLTDKGRRLRRFTAWYEMLIGGYGGTLARIGEGLGFREPLPRHLDKVGTGSCGISHYDAIPLTRRLLNRMPTPPRRIVDIGCGNALYLAELCDMVPGLCAIGVEPSSGYDHALALVKERGLEGRVSLFNGTAGQFVQSWVGEPVDVVVLGFVLHEILGQESERGVADFLRALIRKFPDVTMVVIEVESWIDDPARMAHGLARAYYNPYFLLHAFTNQRLERRPFWHRLFEAVGLRVLAVETTDPRVDSTGFELGFLLQVA